MSSKKRGERLDLEHGLPVTGADIIAQRVPPPRMGPDEYLRWLKQWPSPTPEELRKRAGPAPGPMFTL